jgi:uncharacterized membrane protein
MTPTGPVNVSADVTPEHKDMTTFGPSVEDSVVGTWFARIGVLAVLVGAAFGYRYAIDQGWIGPVARVLLGVVTGAGFLIGGHAARGRRWYPFAGAVSGGGIAILYLSTLAALVRYELIGPSFALVALSGVAILGAGLSIAYDSRALSLLSTVGAFANPFLIASGTPADATSVLTYAVAVDIGVVALGYRGRWSLLNKVALVGSIALFAGVAGRVETAEGLAFATALWLLFTAAPFLQVLGSGSPISTGDVVFVSGVSVLFFGAGMYLLRADSAMAQGVFTAALGAACAGFAALASTDERTRPLLRDVMGAISIGWFTMAAPIATDGATVSLFWSVQGALTMWFASRMRDERLTAVSVVLVTVGLIGAADHLSSYQPTTLFLSGEAALVAAQLLSIAAASFLYGRASERPDEWTSIVGLILAVITNVLFLGWISREVSFEINRQAIPELASAAVLFGQSLTWAVYASALLVAGVVRRIPWARYFAIALFGLTIVKMVTVDVWELTILHRMIAFVGLGALLLACSLMYNRFRDLVVLGASGAVANEAQTRS